MRGTRVGGSGGVGLWARHCGDMVNNLQRGCTSAVVEGISASKDGQWTAVGRGNGLFVCSRLIRMAVILIRGLKQLALYYVSFSI